MPDDDAQQARKAAYMDWYCGRILEPSHEAAFNAGAEWQREQTPRYEVLAEQAERITELEVALTECRGALSELRQNARCSTDPAFVRAFDAVTAVLARTAPETLEVRA